MRRFLIFLKKINFGFGKKDSKGEPLPMSTLGYSAGVGIWGFRKGAKPVFCLWEFSYYYEHPWI